MKCSTLLAKMQSLWVISFFSRPRVSDDNPYIESLFRTYNYCSYYPKYFESLEQVISWSLKFVNWYNKEYRYSGIKFVTPEQRHKREDIEVLEKRQDTYKKAKAKHTERWSREIRDWSWLEVVHLNPATKKVPNYFRKGCINYKLRRDILTNTGKLNPIER